MKEKINIAIADDHVLFRQGILELINWSNDLVVTLEAGNGEELLSALEENSAPVDLLILDIDMPKLDGLEVLETLQSVRPNLPCIVLTMITDERFAAHSVRLGAKAFLPKNVDYPILKEAILTVANGGSYFTDEVADAVARRLNPPEKERQRLPNGNILYAKETTVLHALVDGKTAQDIGEEMELSRRTIEGYRHSLLIKTGTKNTAELITYAFRNKLIT